MEHTERYINSAVVDKSCCNKVKASFYGLETWLWATGLQPSMKTWAQSPKTYIEELDMKVHVCNPGAGEGEIG